MQGAPAAGGHVIGELRGCLGGRSRCYSSDVFPISPVTEVTETGELNNSGFLAIVRNGGLATNETKMVNDIHRIELPEGKSVLYRKACVARRAWATS